MALLALALMSVGTSCTHDFDETNKDPNNMVVGDLHDPWAMFEPLFYGEAKTYFTYYTWFWNDELAQYTVFSAGSTREEHRYKIGQSNWNSFWNNLTTYGNNAQHMIDLAQAYNQPEAQAVATTLKVLYMSNLTDMFGDIPYREAFQARKSGNTTPVFEPQQQVYEEMLADLDSANSIYAQHTGVNQSLKSLDIMYGGDMNKWRKFNNSLMLRLLCRVSGRAEMNAGSRIQAMLDNQSHYPIIASNDDNATIEWTGVDPFRNYFAENNYLESGFTSGAYHAAEELIKLTLYIDDKGVQAYTDPRLPIWCVQAADGWIGGISGCTPAERAAQSSAPCKLNYPVLVRPQMPTYIMDYAEVEFILSEMAQRGLISGGEEAARAYYEAGVTASISKWAPMGSFSDRPVTVGQPEIDAYLASSLGSWDASSNKLELIGNQKYLALFWTGMEAYHEIRRTGYPVLTIGNGTDYNDYQYPQRFAYPQTTVANNRDHVQEALDRMGGANDMKTPVWWSKQAITGQLLFTYQQH